MKPYLHMRVQQRHSITNIRPQRQKDKTDSISKDIKYRAQYNKNNHQPFYIFIDGIPL
jgi:hypothetical protein